MAGPIRNPGLFPLHSQGLWLQGYGASLPLFLFPPTCSDGPRHNLGSPIPTCDGMRNSGGARDLIWPPEAEWAAPGLTEAAQGATALSLPQKGQSATHSHILPYSQHLTLQNFPCWAELATQLVLAEAP